MLMSCTLLAQTHIWTGDAGDNNWFTATNWNSGTVPDGDSDVLLESGSLVEIDAAAAVSTITIDNGASLMLQANLTITNAVTIDDDGLLTWRDGTIAGGAIENNGLLLVETVDTKVLDNVSITNNSQITVQNANGINLFNAVQIINSAQAIFTVASNGSFLSQDQSNHLFLNEGLLQKVSHNGTDPGTFYLILNIENHGVLKTDHDQMFLILGNSIHLTNFEAGRIEGFGTLDITANFTNLGSYDPGDDSTAGTIHITNDFATSSQSTLIVDILGPNAGEYDVYENFGFPILNGNIEINLDYVPQFAEEFVIFTANEIIECNLPAQVTSSNEGVVFDVICNQTSVVLKAVEVLSAEDIFSETFDLAIVPNPVNTSTTFSFPSEFISEENLQIVIYTIQGQKIDTIDQPTDGVAYDRSGLASGLYFARLEADGAVLATQKMVLK